MYVKTQCPHCANNSYIGAAVDIIETETGNVLDKIEIVDTLTEKEFISIAGNFILQNVAHKTNKREIRDVLCKCMGISPQSAEELTTKLINECKKVL